MAGRGPAPKDADRRARRNKQPEMRVIVAEPAVQPALPKFTVSDGDGGRIQFVWPAQTEAWWRMWSESPLSADFTANDWSELLDTALIHAKLWSGDVKAAAELRLRVAKFGATPEDRARLRITFAQANAVEDVQADRRSSSARHRYGGLKLAE